ncbi:MAG: DNA polymerase IV [Paludibacteraceae bacterium]
MERRKIIHIDMDAFYASVEQRDNPYLRGKPVAVGHAGKRGVVAAASYEARKYGVRSAMSSFKAKEICPFLIFVPCRMDVYKSISAEIHDIFHEYTDIIEPISYDEAFLDVTTNKPGIELGVEIAKEIKQKIYSRLGLVASAGVSFNKFLAKIASDYRKPNGLCTIHPDVALKYIDPLPVEAFWGIGKVTAVRMHALGIKTGADLRHYPIEQLAEAFGRQAVIYSKFANGIDDRQVEASHIRKSVGCENTFDNDISEKEEMKLKLRTELLPDLLRRMEHACFEGRTLTIKIKYSDFTQRTISKSANHTIASKDEILEMIDTLTSGFEMNGQAIRLLGLSVSSPLRMENDGQYCIDF